MASQLVEKLIILVFICNILVNAVVSSVVEKSNDSTSSRAERYFTTDNLGEAQFGHGTLPTNRISSSKHDYFSKRETVANLNLHRGRLNNRRNVLSIVGDAPYKSYLPNTSADHFEIPTLSGEFKYTKVNASIRQPILISTYSDYSGFLQCLWNCSNSLEDLVNYSPKNVSYVFISENQHALTDAVWMKNRFKSVIHKMQLKQRLSADKATPFMNQLHFATVSISELGNWIPIALKQWLCLDHNCGYDQVKFEFESTSNFSPLVLKRLDARYDWLPSPSAVFGNKVLSPEYFKNSCDNSSSVQLNGKIALTISGNCSFVTQILHAQQRGAIGVIVLEPTGGVRDMKCADAECGLDIHIPATSVPYDSRIIQATNLNVTFQNTPSSNFFMAIDHHGNLQEVGWFLYPTMHFLAWQAQWFNYRAALEANLSKPAYVVSVFNDSIMHGAEGVSTTISLPPFEELKHYSTLELDMALGCPGTNDRDCAHWDHTVSLTLCSDFVCDLEIGRWITSFRRRIGRWLTDITPLLPLFNGPGTGKALTFTMKTAAWALPWKPSLNLRLSGRRQKGDLYPSAVKPLYNSRGFNFDKKYNTLFKPMQFQVPSHIKKVEIFAVITGHGSDENGCGEFCVTSHVFTVNGRNHSITFDAVGSSLGCADQVPFGSEPNEHGTWLYGRDGWCDGQNVKPWIIDVTEDVTNNMTSFDDTIVTSQDDDIMTSRFGDSVIESTMVVHYQGFFNGTDPNPKKNPGVMIFASYLVFYEEL